MKRHIAAFVLLAAFPVATYAQDTMFYESYGYLYPEKNNSAYKTNAIERSTLGDLRGQWFFPNGETTVYGIAITYSVVDWDGKVYPYHSAKKELTPSLYIQKEWTRPFEVDTTWPGYSDSTFWPLFDTKKCLELDNRLFTSDTATPRKELIFHYDYNLPTPGAFDVHCTEFYFDHPSMVSDTFCLGVLAENYTDYGNGLFIRPRGLEMENMPNTYVELCTPEKFARTGFCEVKNTYILCRNRKETFFTYYEYNDTSVHRCSWGGIFPIVGLRCTPVRGIRKVSQGKGWAWVDWNRFDDGGTTYDVRAWQYSVVAPGDTAVLWDTLFTTTDTAQLFEGLALGGSYTVRLRKSCRYATPGYDTTVYSPWSEPLHFQFDTYDWEGIDELPQQDFGLLPNPAHGTVTLALRQRTAQGGHVEVADALGRTLLRQPLQPDADALTLDIARLPAGTYLVKLLSPQGLTVRRLMVR